MPHEKVEVIKLHDDRLTTDEQVARRNLLDAAIAAAPDELVIAWVEKTPYVWKKKKAKRGAPPAKRSVGFIGVTINRNSKF